MQYQKTVMKQSILEDAWERRMVQAVLAMGALFLLMMVPAFYYSLNTPFALVDDLNDSMSISMFRSFAHFRYWADSIFIGVPDAGRYRPLFDLHNALAWLVLGPHPTSHHVVRWMEWLTGMIFWNAALWRVVRIRFEGSASGMPRLPVLLAMLIFNAFVSFFPNQPVARLAPQELHSFCFLGLLFLGAIRLITDPGGAARGGVIARTCMMIVGYVGLSMAKEINVALMAMFCVFLFGFALIRRNWCVLSAVVPAVGLLLYTVWRIHVASSAASYGRLEIGIPLLVGNLRWLGRDAFQFATSPVFTAVILASVVGLGWRALGMIRRLGVTRDVESLVFSLGMTISLCAILMISWLPVLRYFYPLVPLLGWHLARGSLELSQNVFFLPARKKALGVLMLVVLGWFVLANYHGFLLQFAVQHNTRNIEQRVLSTMEQRLKSGQPMAISCDRLDPELELMLSVKTYFEYVLPMYRGEKPGLRILATPDSATGVVLASRHELDGEKWRLVEKITCPHPYVLLGFAERISGKLQGRRHLRTVQDAGTHGFDYAWYFYEPVGGCATR